MGKKRHKKYTIEEVKNIFKEQGCELKAQEYKNSSTPMPYTCSCGNDSKICLNSFKAGNRCKECGKEKSRNKQKYSYEYVYNYFKEQGCELRSKTYKNARTLLDYRCSCGNISKIIFWHFLKGHRCNKCGTKRGADKLRYSYEEVKNIFEENGCKLISETYENGHFHLDYICVCGREAKISLSKFLHGERCAKCAGNEKLTYEYVYNYFKEQKCELLETFYVNCKTKMRYICSCGNISKITFSCFRSGHRCNKCGIKRAAEKNRGKNSCWYNPNITDEERISRRHTPENRAWTKVIYEKDNYICQKCSQVGGKLNAHHVYNYSTNEELRYDDNNGITLCKKCHIKFHKKYGYKNNSQEQLDKFLNLIIFV
jgi:hypothetical protein